VFRDGVQIATLGNVASYADLGVQGNSRYSYTVRAYDTAGNTSPPSVSATVTTAAPPRTITVTPAADATIVSGSPTANFGTAKTLEADASPVKSFLLKFDVAGVGTGMVTSARLRLHVANESDRGGDVRATAGAWSETSVAWGTAPAGTALAASLGAVALGSWQDVALAPGIVIGDGAVSLRVDSTSTDGAAYDAREAGATLAPQLVLTVADASVPDTAPPTAPSDLTAVAASGRVDLAWNAATDDVRVAGYRILRNGIEIGTTNETIYSDTAVAGATTYSYQVVAYDPSDHVSPPSNTATVTTPAADRVLTFFPSADASILFDTPTTNQGTASDLQADNSPVKSFLLKFTVSGIGTGRVTGAKLRLHVTNNSDRGGNFTRISDAWLENTVTWSTAPAAGTSVGSLGVVGLATWQELPLAAGTVTADGVLSLRVDSTSSDGVGYDSREAGTTLAPQLIVTVAG
jgi:chitodextrinase